jgi:hypothetical protein
LVTPHDYLTKVLAEQAMRSDEFGTIRTLREQIEGHLRQQLGSAPRIYYGGSYGKGTMIREGFDLDLVLYYPPTERSSLQQIFSATHLALVNSGYVVEPKTVALRLPYQPEFHVDVVPGRAQDAAFRYATLYKNTTPPSTLQTSLKVHIDAVRKTGLQPIVMLVKLWRRRHNVPLPTFALEILAARALAGQRRDDLGRAITTVLQYISQEVGRVRLEDPANTNNLVELSVSDRRSAASAAANSLAAPYWEHIVW